MSKRTSIPKERPKKPLTHYFKFRTDRLKELQGQANRMDIIKEEWASLPEDVKESEKEKYKKDLEKYNTLMEDWRKANPAEKSKPKGKAIDEADEDDEEPPKKDKTKGAQKAAKKGKKEESEEEEKPEKGKSKGRKEEKAETEHKSKRGKK